jgi:hypothetical protein
MDTKQKKDFINSLITAVQNELIAKVDKMPADWDGIELRQLIADKFAECVIERTMPKRSARMKAYRNTVIVENL